MKKINKIITVIILMLLIFAAIPNATAFACEINIVPSKPEVAVNEIISVDILRTKTHTVCVLPLDDTKIEITGGEIVKEYPWINGTPDKKTIEVKFTKVGEGVIKVTRDCPKGGLIVQSKTVKVVASNTDAQAATPKDTNSVSNSETQSQNAVTQQTATGSSSTSVFKSLFSVQNILYILLILSGLMLFIIKKFKWRYFLLLFSLAILGFYFGGCLCPVGFPEKIWLTPLGSVLSTVILIMLGIITVITLFKGRIFCGWVCPHGALQEFLFQKKTAIKLNPAIDYKECITCGDCINSCPENRKKPQ
ncbi:MAG: 4Fe-4S binding protein [Thermoanaerobacteraceae bacterium]|nr:4Fe-4S binding protein [Thermoanaerobacteraceae bacterium]